MKKLGMLGMLAVFIGSISLVLTSAAFAQAGPRWRGSGGWGPGSQYSRMFNPATLETVGGEVVSVDKITPMRGMSSGVHLTLKAENETISVHLGPDWYIENQDINIEPKDEIVVKGSRVAYEGKPAIIASELRKGDAILTLRNAWGIPAWSAWRRW